jgi:hypothetical protein
MTLPTITTDHYCGAVEWRVEAPDGSRVKLRSPFPDGTSWRLVVSLPRRGWTDEGATPDAAVAAWNARISAADVPADVVALVGRITTEARLWATEAAK